MHKVSQVSSCKSPTNQFRLVVLHSFQKRKRRRKRKVTMKDKNSPCPPTPLPCWGRSRWSRRPSWPERTSGSCSPRVLPRTNHWITLTCTNISKLYNLICVYNSVCVLAHKLHTVWCVPTTPRRRTLHFPLDAHTHNRKTQLPAAAAWVAQPHVGPRRRRKRSSPAQQDVVSERRTWFSRNWRTKHFEPRLCCSVKKKKKREFCYVVVAPPSCFPCRP